MTAARFYSSTAGAMVLVGGISDAATSLVVDTAAGLPSTPFTLILDPALATEEAVTCTTLGGTTCTVTRGVDGTSAQAHSNGAPVRHGFTARDFQESRNHEDATVAHSATGAVVGTTNSQTLTNKSIDGETNTITNIKPPTGSILMYGAAGNPTGYVQCDGASLLRAGTYAALFAVIGTTYGSADGTHFNVPNLNNSMFPRGGAIGTTGGAATHVLTTAEMPVHTHVQDAHNHTQDAHNHTQNAHDHQTFASTWFAYADAFSAGTFSGIQGLASGDLANPRTQSVAATNQAATATNNTSVAVNQNAGSGAAHNNLPPYVGVNFIIKI